MIEFSTNKALNDECVSMTEKISNQSFSSKKNMMWFVKSFCVHSTIRGNVLWGTIAVIDEYEKFFIISANLIKTDDSWTAEIKTEETTEFVHCPLCYLFETEEINPEWRKKVNEFHKEKKMSQEIRDKIREGNKVKIYLKGTSVNSVIAEYDTPLRGRIDGKGVLFRIPSRKIKDYDIINSND